MKKKSKRRFGNDIYAYFLMAPGLLLIAVVLMFPLLRAITSSFFVQELGGMKFTSFAGLTYYNKLLGDQIFARALKNSIIWTLEIVAVEFLIAIVIALILNKDFKGRGIYRSLILIPWVVPSVSAAMTWKWMYSAEYGVINYILKSLNITNQTIDWLGSEKMAPLSIIVTSIWKGIPFVVIVLLAALQSIDQTQYEAAKMDGANSFQCFLHITLNGIKEVTITTLLLQFIWIFNQFDLVFMMTKGGPSNVTQIVPVYTYLTALNFFDFNYAAALGCVGLLIVLIPSVFYIKRNVKAG